MCRDALPVCERGRCLPLDRTLGANVVTDLRELEELRSALHRVNAAARAAATAE